MSQYHPSIFLQLTIHNDPVSFNLMIYNHTLKGYHKMKQETRKNLKAGLCVLTRILTLAFYPRWKLQCLSEELAKNVTA
jgi:hypothetical protein